MFAIAPVSLKPESWFNVSRVALLVNFVPPYRLPVYEALQSRVRQLRVFTSTPMEPNRSWPVNWGSLDVIEQRTVTVKKHWRDSTGVADVGFVHFPYDTFAQLGRFNPDTIISSELGFRTVLAAWYKRRHPHVRLVVWATVSEHTERNRGRLRTMLRPGLLKQADAVLVNGASGARYIAGLGVPQHRLVLAPYTTDVGAFVAATRPPVMNGVVRLLYVGALIERKGLLPFLTILRQWAVDHPERRVEFDIAGEGPLKSTLEAFQSAPNLTLRFLDGVRYDRLAALYATAHIFVLPTLADEWGVVVNEAMAAGLPVLGSRLSQAVEELVAEDETGWTFMPDDVETVSGAIDRALSSTVDDHRRMGGAAARRASQITPDLVADRIAKVLCPSQIQSS